MRTPRAFTLLELLVILVVITILVTISLPALLSSKVETNETAAQATLRQIVRSQIQFATTKSADENVNGNGEYGTFGEMSGNVPVRASNGGTNYLSPYVINPSFRAVSPLGELFKGGYYYRIYLPDPTGAGTGELPGGGASPAVDPQLAEIHWCAYAWPQKFGVTGNKTFFVNEHGDITFTENKDYAGPGAAIAPGAGFRPGGALTSITGIPAVNTTGRDGNMWRSRVK
jgi:type II secretory pathway pseudopilin PulG